MIALHPGHIVSMMGELPLHAAAASADDDDDDYAFAARHCIANTMQTKYHS